MACEHNQKLAVGMFGLRYVWNYSNCCYLECVLFRNILKLLFFIFLKLFLTSANQNDDLHDVSKQDRATHRSKYNYYYFS